jgi:hypothetical protein
MVQPGQAVRRFVADEVPVHVEAEKPSHADKGNPNAVDWSMTLTQAIGVGHRLLQPTADRRIVHVVRAPAPIAWHLCQLPILFGLVPLPRVAAPPEDIRFRFAQFAWQFARIRERDLR